MTHHGQSICSQLKVQTVQNWKGYSSLCNDCGWRAGHLRATFMLSLTSDEKAAKCVWVPLGLSLDVPCLPGWYTHSTSLSSHPSKTMQWVAVGLLLLSLNCRMKMHSFEMRGLKNKTVAAPAEFKCQKNMNTLETFPGSLWFCPFRRSPPRHPAHF